ncbi:SDR family NAD(P)-dependent oxidoreductase [Novosphingobium album (ex Liu et al. 2023)]|uniref:SDR family oxidoreductase n=1 Tax=Novosphingobium album (ex Liu et al. 2023) TaxID=3031130 RepID=A0ABT5WQZ0_9SPHN|nr:SDR family oxidoreductase [Novosphingobium album (ex Liu et al. 2023)]MDE8652410.1 SDR family oxidoreductase [Novosphingobium album (ex Liu et al. 2023)]
MTEISGRTAVVTGGGNGIGMGLAKELARQGAKVAVADIMLANAEKVADAIRQAGGTAIAVECDVCEREAIAAMKAEIAARLGPVQLLFANAGATAFDPLMEMSDADVDWILQVNLHGVMNTTRAFLPDMMAGREGHICATASMAGLLPGWIPVHAPYSAAKAGIIGLMMNLALELGEYNIHTTSYCPGGVATGMKANNARYRPAKFGGPGEGEVAISEASKDHTSMDFYTPDAIAPMVLNAVRNNRAFIFDHPEQRAEFRRTYASVVEACYDDADAWHREHGTPAANPHGAMLVTG